MNVIPSDCELSDTDDSDDEEYDEVEGDSDNFEWSIVNDTSLLIDMKPYAISALPQVKREVGTLLRNARSAMGDLTRESIALALFSERRFFVQMFVDRIDAGLTLLDEPHIHEREIYGFYYMLTLVNPPQQFSKIRRTTQHLCLLKNVS